jgi:hypothetical protein
LVDLRFAHACTLCLWLVKLPGRRADFTFRIKHGLGNL